MASIKTIIDEKGKEHYQVRIRLRGCPLECRTFTKVTDARKWIQDTESSMREGRYFKTREASKHTLGEAIDRYTANVLPTKEKCLQRQGQQLSWWKKKIGHKLLSEVTPAVIAEGRDQLLRETTVRKKPRSNATTVRYMAVLSHLFTIARKEWGWIEDSPISKVTKPKEPRGRVRFLSDEERSRLLKACQASHSPLLYPAVVLSIATGMRKSELLSLTWPQVSFDKERIILFETKNGERRSVPIKGLGLVLLKRLYANRTSVTSLLFPGKDPLKPIDLRVAWEKALKESSVTAFRWHDLRHCTASYLAMNKASLAEIAEILGHKTLTCTKRYSHLSETHVTGVVASMNERIFGNTGS